MSRTGFDPKTASALVIQSGSRPLLSRALPALQARHPEGRLTVLVQRGQGVFPDGGLHRPIEVIENPGPSPAFLRGLRERRFDCVYVLWTGEPGYWKLKLLPAALWPVPAFAIDEGLRIVPVEASSAPALARHLRVRLEGPVALADGFARLWRKGLAGVSTLAVLRELASARRRGGAGE